MLEVGDVPFASAELHTDGESELVVTKGGVEEAEEGRALFQLPEDDKDEDDKPEDDKAEDDKAGDEMDATEAPKRKHSHAPIAPPASQKQASQPTPRHAHAPRSLFTTGKATATPNGEGAEANAAAADLGTSKPVKRRHIHAPQAAPSTEQPTAAAARAAEEQAVAVASVADKKRHAHAPRAPEEQTAQLPQTTPRHAHSPVPSANGVEIATTPTEVAIETAVDAQLHSNSSEGRRLGHGQTSQACLCTGSCTAPSCSCSCSGLPTPSCSVSSSSNNANRLWTPSVEAGLAMRLTISSEGSIAVQARGYAKMDAFAGINVAVAAASTWTSGTKFGSMSALDVKQDWVTLSTDILEDGVVGFCDIASSLCDGSLASALDVGAPSLSSLYPSGLSRGFAAATKTACTALPSLSGFPGAVLDAACTTPDLASRTKTVSLAAADLPSIDFSSAANTIADAFDSLPAFDAN